MYGKNVVRVLVQRRRFRRRVQRRGHGRLRQQRDQLVEQ